MNKGIFRGYQMFRCGFESPLPEGRGFLDTVLGSLRLPVVFRPTLGFAALTANLHPLWSL